MIEILIRVGASLFLAVALGAAFGVLVGILEYPEILVRDGKAEKQPPRWPPVSCAPAVLPPAILADALQDRGFVRPGASRAAVSVKVSPRWPPVPKTQKHVDERVRLYMAAKTGSRS